MILILVSIFCLIEVYIFQINEQRFKYKFSKGEKATKKQKRNIKMFKKLKARAKAMEQTLISLNDTLIAANKTASVSTRLVFVG